jgi:hypothetical protein
MTVAALASISRASALASCVTSRGSRTIRAPKERGRYNSSTAMSKDKLVVARMMSQAFIPGACAMDWRKFTIAWCATITPLGVPVEPEV